MICATTQAYAKPPALVELTLSGVMTVLQKTPTWDEAKKQLGDANFMMKLLEFDKDKLNDALLKKLQKFTTNPEFTPEVSPVFVHVYRALSPQSWGICCVCHMSHSGSAHQQHCSTLQLAHS